MIVKSKQKKSKSKDIDCFFTFNELNLGFSFQNRITKEMLRKSDVYCEYKDSMIDLKRLTINKHEKYKKKWTRTSYYQ